MIGNKQNSIKLSYLFLACFLLVLLLISNRFGFITLLGIWAIMVLLFIPLKQYIDKTSLLILAFSCLYMVFGVLTKNIKSIIDMLSAALPMLPFYLFGKCIGREFNEKVLLKYIAFILLSYSLEIFATIILKIVESGQFYNSSREFYLLGDPNRMLSATLVGLRLGCGIIGIPLSFSLYKFSKSLGNLYLLIGLLSFVSTIYLVNRTAIVILVIVSTLNIYYWRGKKSIFVIVLLLFGAFLLFQSEGGSASEIFQAYSDRNDNLITGGGRTMRWQSAIVNLFKYPLGWTDDIGYVHNMWLDIAKISGVIPFFLLLLLTIISLRDLLILLKIRRNCVVIMLISFYLAVFMSCFVEPIYGGTQLFIFTMIWGIERSLIKINKSL